MAGSTGLDRSSESALANAIGHRVSRIDRVFFQYQGELRPGDGPLELELDDGSVLHLAGAGDGQSLLVERSRWRDPFTEPLSAENKKFVEESGCWRRVLVSEEPDYRDVVGAPIVSVEILVDRFGVAAGVAIEIGAKKLWFVVEFDECHLYWAAPIGFRSIAAPALRP